MLLIRQPSHDPYLNMAVEEYLLMQLSKQEDCFMLWQNSPAVILGRNQNAFEEIDQAYVAEHAIAVVRRLTGGGAVYHDLGNLNFTLVVADGGQGFDFQRFARPVIAALAEFGVTAELSGRNDILVNGQKFSGNAEYRHDGRLLHHGTLLFSSDLSVLSHALRVKPQKIASKGIKSVQSRVTNLREHLAPDVSLADFQAVLLQATAREFGASLREYQLTDEDLAAINQLKEQKYASWQWNYGHAPQFNLRREARFPFGMVDVRLEIKQGKIARCQIFGDYFSNSPTERLTEQLLGQQFTRPALQAALSDQTVSACLPGLDKPTLIAWLLDQLQPDRQQPNGARSEAPLSLNDTH